jgi:hypothetical protein
MIPFALLAMAIHRLPLWLQKGCTFWKLLGSGRNGTFDLHPDWQQWGLLAVWDDRETFDKFDKSGFVAKWWDMLATERWTVLLEPLQSHGKWDGKTPFDNPNVTEYTGIVAVLTRATIRFNKLKAFWSNVDSVTNIMASAPGYVTSFGIGEAPVYRQATFSIWKSVNDVKNFAYASREHANVIKKTRDENWYSEELFARFKLIASFGTINGKNPIENLIFLNISYENNSRVTSP